MRVGDRSRPSLAERTRQEVGDAKRRRILSQIASIEMIALDANDAEDIPPLAIGRLPTFPIPTQFLQQNIFRRMHVKRLARAYFDRLPAFQLLLVEWRAARDKDVHFQLCSMMDEIRTRSRPYGSPDAGVVYIEVR